ncbi:hypothetical protein CANCADRAFT_3780 [Tortispora caseinolytica NRRL Y-17796]|uniref:Borealin N-terminal domain-containing protein n=1 Tax=Tortispora caseinolytica NRRL Y-17796 TaxID=767744 RepID=A0A1E4TBK8_9ASCO|nr:hypothetical protein CANCADRAFT_3780 [Tortispora caseinolytica NRRL Y-17796]
MSNFDGVIENLELELEDRVQRLEAQYKLAAESLDIQLELRKVRVPSGVRKLTLRQLREGKYPQKQLKPKRPLKTILPPHLSSSKPLRFEHSLESPQKARSPTRPR